MKKRHHARDKVQRTVCVLVLVALLILAMSMLSIESAVGEGASVSVSVRVAPAIRVSSDGSSISNTDFVRIERDGVITFISL